MPIENPRASLKRTDMFTWHPQRRSTMVRKNPITSYVSLPEVKKGDFIYGYEKNPPGLSTRESDKVTDEGIATMFKEEGVTRDQHHHSTSLDND